MNLSNYLKEVVRELKLSTFPTQNTVLNFTIFVIVFTAVVAVYLGALDLGFGKGTIGFVEMLKTSEFVSGLNINKVDTSVVEIATTTATNTATVTDILLK